MEKRNLVEKKIYEEKAFKIVTDLAVKTIDENTLISIVTKKYLFYSNARAISSLSILFRI